MRTPVRTPVFTVTQQNSKTIFFAAKAEVERLEEKPDVIEYKRQEKIVKDYGDDWRDIVKPWLSIQSQKIVFKRNIELPNGVEPIITIPKGNGLKFNFKGLQANVSYRLPGNPKGTMMIKLKKIG